MGRILAPMTAKVLATLQEKVDLIILDVHMPRMDGFECAPGSYDRAIATSDPLLTASMRSDEAHSQGLDLGAVDSARPSMIAS